MTAAIRNERGMPPTARAERPLPEVRTVRVVANPAAGRDEAVLATLNRAWADGGPEWDVSVTRSPGDGERAAREAVEQGVDAVASYGGDGTVAEVAAGLAGTGVPLVILPGGTANVLAHELGVPTDLEAAARLLLAGGRLRRIDLAATDRGKPFVLRAGIGWEAETVEGAPRELKDKLGELAYVFSGVRELAATPRSRFRILVDGEEYLDEGISCVVANSASLGVGELVLHPDVKVDDGLLDVVVIRRADVAALVRLVADAARQEAAEDLIGHLSGSEIVVEADPVRSVVLDGESAGETPLTARVMPGAVEAVVPPPAPGVDAEGEPAPAAGGR